MIDRTTSMRKKIDLYESSRFVGHGDLSSIEGLLKKYKKSAEARAENIDWGSVVLYAVLDYDPHSLSVIAADFMLLELKYESFTGLVDRLTDGKRFFFIRGRKEYEYE